MERRGGVSPPRPWLRASPRPQLRLLVLRMLPVFPGCQDCEIVPRRGWVEPVTRLELASPPWEGGVLTPGRYRHITFSCQLSTVNFRLPEPPTPAKRSKFVKRYSVGRPPWVARSPYGGSGWDSNRTTSGCARRCAPWSTSRPYLTPTSSPAACGGSTAPSPAHSGQAVRAG